nr:enoyl-CoA hydratase [Lachnospiraceae bacterium]
SVIAGNAPIAVRNCKKAINDGLELGMDDAIILEEKLFGDCFESYDQKEGMANFLRKKDDPAKVKHVAFKNE